MKLYHGSDVIVRQPRILLLFHTARAVERLRFTGSEALHV